MNVRVFRTRTASEDGFFHQPKNSAAILRHDFQPSPFAQHREIDSAETETGEKNIDAVTERLVIERLDRLGQRFRAVSMGPAVLDLRVSFINRHLQRGVRHSKRYELLPMLTTGETAGGFQSFIERCRGQ